MIINKKVSLDRILQVKISGTDVETEITSPYTGNVEEEWH